MLGSFRMQAAVDFMLSYGMALIIIFIAMAVIYKVSVTTPVISTPNCAAIPGFGCEYYALNRSGILTFTFSQTTGGTIKLLGAACSSQVNNTGNKPAYGNVKVTNTVNSIAQPLVPYYFTSANTPGLGVNVYSDSSNTIFIYCYTGSGVATGRLGNSYTGYVWLNYSIPYYGNIVQQIASVSLKYT